MPVKIIVPQMGESVVEATVAQWLKKPGEPVQAGDDLVELETDKVNQVIQAESAGVLESVAFQAGDTVKVGAILGTLNESGAPAPAAAPAPATTEAASKSATPVAGAIASANHVDLAGVTPTGPAGKIGKDDVTQKLGAAPAVEKQVAPPPPAPRLAAPSGRPEERVRFSRKRQTIAQNLKTAQNTAAMLTTFNEVDMTAVMELRKRRKEDFEKRFGIGLGFMSFFTKAVVGALKQFPTVNAELQGEELVLKKYYDIGIAVGVEDGLVVPVVRDADGLTFAGIEKKIKEVAEKAKTGTLSLSDLTGGTFTITNGGVYGSLMSTPILNFPQVGILGLHAIKERAVVIGGEIVARPMMYIALSYDHRVIDGGTAVRFLVKVKELIEDPESLLLEG